MYDNELYVNDPARVKTQAATITTAANTFNTAWQSAKSELTTHHAAKPWGTDSLGMAFLAGYGDPTGSSQGLTNQDGQGVNGADAPAAKIVAGTDDVAGRVVLIGPAITDLMNGVIDDDALIATWFGEE